MKLVRHSKNVQRHYQRLRKRLARAKSQTLSLSKRQQLYRRLRDCEQQLALVAGAAALSSLPMTALQAQVFCPQEGMNNPFSGVDVDRQSTPQLVDVDGDSDLDLISGNYDGDIIYYQNDGSNNFTQVTGTANPFDGINVGAYLSTPQLVDVDGDSDLDLISGNYDGNLVYYQNDGSSNFTQVTGTANPFDGLSAGYDTAPQLVDVDGDSDLDLVVGNFNGEVVYFQNDGANNFTQVTGTADPFDGIDVGGSAIPQLVDVDRDGDLDLIVGDYYGEILYYQNDGSDNFTQVTGTANPFAGIDVGYNAAPQLVNVDGDADLELVTGNFDGTINYFLDQPTCLPSSVDGFVDCASDPFDGIDVGYNSAPQLVDVDGDLDLDLIVGNDRGEIFFYQNDGNDNFTPITGTDNPFASIDVGSFATPQLVDVDGDSDLDLISGEFNGEVQYYQNDGSNTFSPITGTDNPFNTIDAGSFSTPQLVDVDGDSNLDVISGEDSGTIVYYRNDGSGNYTEVTGAANPFNNIDVGDRSAPQLVDVDGDLDLDLIVGNVDGEILYYQNDGANNFTLATGTTNSFEGIDVGYNSTPQLIDLDSDGDLDLISGERDGTIQYFQDAQLDVTASAAACTGNSGEVELTINSSEGGPFTVSNAFSGTVGSLGQPTAVETVMTGITEPGTYVFEISTPDGCVQTAATADINSNCAVPVELLYFQAKATKANQAQLAWSTASELNNSHFIVERSRDGKQFMPIGKVRGAGTTVEQQDYFFLDETPFEGVNYYRLQQVDVDGTYEYSDVESVYINEKEATLAIFPIPTQTTLNYDASQLNGVEAIYLFDLMGRLVKTDRQLNGTLDVSDLPSGQYTLIFEGKGRRIHRLVQKL